MSSYYLLRAKQNSIGAGSVRAGQTIETVLNVGISNRVVQLFDIYQLISSRKLIVTLLLVAAFFCSAIGVVHSSYLSRKNFAEQELLLKQQDKLQLEWTQLLLEQSAWSSPGKIESVASGKLDMVIPEARDIKLVR